jgi:predicted phage terminase large subunit-like protein
MDREKAELELLRLLEEEARERTKTNYARYVEYVHEGRWLLGKHLLFICDQIEKLLSNQMKEEILIISMPPQHGKSMCVTETLPSWYLGNNPDKRVIEVSYGDDLARRFGRLNKRKIEQFGKELFNIELSTDSRSDTEFGIAKHQGSMISRGIMAGITGQPGDLIIIDDPVKNRQEADSETYRDRMWEEWMNSINTRRSANCKVILIQTRWHEDDLAGRLIATIPNKCKVINMPCEAEDNDILGRCKGDSLFPEIGKDKEWLQEFKLTYATLEGNRAWLALFQGRPTAEEGNLIKRQWWKYYDKLPNMIQMIMSVDAAFKDEDTSDPVAIQVWGKRNADMYLIDNINARMDFPATVQTIRNVKAKYPKMGRILIEDKANGSATIQVLRREIPGIIAIKPEGGKVARVNAVSHAIESGNVYLPQNATWVNDFVEQASAFPNGKHDDMVDAMSQALNRFMYYSADIPSTAEPTEDLTPQQKYTKDIRSMTKVPKGFHG